MMMPRRAASEIEPMIATGMAINSGQGVATTSTARNRIASPLAAQAASGDRHGQRRVEGAQLIAQPADLRPVLLRGSASPA